MEFKIKTKNRGQEMKKKDFELIIKKLHREILNWVCEGKGKIPLNYGDIIDAIVNNVLIDYK